MVQLLKDMQKVWPELLVAFLVNVFILGVIFSLSGCGPSKKRRATFQPPVHRVKVFYGPGIPFSERPALLSHVQRHLAYLEGYYGITVPPVAIEFSDRPNPQPCGHSVACAVIPHGPILIGRGAERWIAHEMFHFWKLAAGSPDGDARHLDWRWPHIDRVGAQLSP